MFRFKTLAFLALACGTTALAAPPRGLVPPPTVTITFPEEGTTVSGDPALSVVGLYTPETNQDGISVTVVDSNNKVTAIGTANKLNGVWTCGLKDIPKGNGYRVCAYIDNQCPAVFSNVPTFNVK